MQGREVNGAGINTSFVIHQDVKRPPGLCIRWSKSAPVFQTTLGSGVHKSDIFGERGVLLGGIHGIVESLTAGLSGSWFDSPAGLFQFNESITGPITQQISKGILAVYQLMRSQSRNFKLAYSTAYHPLFEILIYDEVMIVTRFVV